MDQHVMGQVDFQGRFLGNVATAHLISPIKEWFVSHPEELAHENHFFARFDHHANGGFRCFLDLVGRHHWHAVEQGMTLPIALRNSLESLIPDVWVSEFDDREI